MAAIRAYMAAESGTNGVILCAREWMNSLKDSSMSEVKGAIDSEQWLKDYFDVGQEYIRTKNGRVEFIFTGLNRNLDSLKSKASILIAWVDEAEGVSETAWNKLEPTVRKEGSEIWVTWNPEKDGSPTDKRFWKERHTLEDDSLVVEVNYPDNPWFPAPLEALRKRQQETLDPNTYAWIWEGEYRQNSDAQILNGKVRVEEFEPGEDWDGPYYGVDFGFAQDPTTGVKCWVYGDRLYVEYEGGKIGLELDDTAEFLSKKVPGIEEHISRADSARPESISYLKRNGLSRMTGVDKWKGSVEDGIEHLRSYRDIVIHPRCAETLREARNYSYKVDRLTGDILPVVVDAHNHYIDAIRYAINPLIKNKGKAPDISVSFFK
jgi:phage terminase large subunit